MFEQEKHKKIDFLNTSGRVDDVVPVIKKKKFKPFRRFVKYFSIFIRSLVIEVPIKIN